MSVMSEWSQEFRDFHGSIWDNPIRIADYIRRKGLLNNVTDDEMTANEGEICVKCVALFSCVIVENTCKYNTPLHG